MTTFHAQGPFVCLFQQLLVSFAHFYFGLLVLISLQEFFFKILIFFNFILSCTESPQCALRRLSLVVASGGCSLVGGVQASAGGGFSCCQTETLEGTGSAAVALGISCSLSCGIFLDQGLNPCPLHWREDSYPLDHQGSPVGVLYVLRDYFCDMSCKKFFCYHCLFFFPLVAVACGTSLTRD